VVVDHERAARTRVPDGAVRRRRRIPDRERSLGFSTHTLTLPWVGLDPKTWEEYRPEGEAR
jgi:hypothetical protein